jgi:hypothetical protein
MDERIDELPLHGALTDAEFAEVFNPVTTALASELQALGARYKTANPQEMRLLWRERAIRLKVAVLEASWQVESVRDSALRGDAL